MSASSMPTLRPSVARPRERLTAAVDLPTPPLPLATATTAPTSGRSSGLREIACAADSSRDSGFGIESSSGADQIAPPEIGVGRAGERVAHHDRVVRRRREPAPRAKSDLHTVDHGPTLELERIFDPESARRPDV